MRFRFFLIRKYSVGSLSHSYPNSHLHAVYLSIDFLSYEFNKICLFAHSDMLSLQNTSVLIRSSKQKFSFLYFELNDSCNVAVSHLKRTSQIRHPSRNYFSTSLLGTTVVKNKTEKTDFIHIREIVYIVRVLFYLQSFCTSKGIYGKLIADSIHGSE